LYFCTGKFVLVQKVNLVVKPASQCEATLRRAAARLKGSDLLALLVQFTCFNSTKVQILTPEREATLRRAAARFKGSVLLALLVQFTCFTSTKVQILTPEREATLRRAAARFKGSV
jgi:hypothetical protein